MVGQKEKGAAAGEEHIQDHTTCFMEQYFLITKKKEKIKSRSSFCYIKVKRFCQRFSVIRIIPNVRSRAAACQ